MPELHTRDELYLLDPGDDANRFSMQWMKSVSALLDEVSKQPAPRALITMARGKSYSHGLDLAWVPAHPDEKGAYIAGVHALLAPLFVNAWAEIYA